MDIQEKNRLVKDWKYAKHFEAGIARLQEELEQIKIRQDELNEQVIKFIFAIEELQKQVETAEAMFSRSQSDTHKNGKD